MRNFFIVTFCFIICLNFVLNSNCGVTDVFQCPDGYTCCQGPTGRICHNVKNGMCCEDLLTCCGEKDNCDNVNHLCVANENNVLNFLSGL